MTDQDRIKQLEAKLAQAKAESARLAAAYCQCRDLLRRLVTVFDSDEDSDQLLYESKEFLSYQGVETALRDLLGPVVELLEIMLQECVWKTSEQLIRSELTRIRAAMGGEK
jgi:hypothetical protein